VDRVDSFHLDFGADGGPPRRAIQGPVADDATYRWLGAFAQTRWPGDDGPVEVVPGVRYSRSELRAGRTEDPETGTAVSRSGSWDTVVGSLRVVGRVGPAAAGHRVYAGVSQGFRAPNLSDLTRLDIARSDEIETPVDDLDPERFLTWELGARTRGDRWSLEVAGHYTRIRDLIVRTPTGREIGGNREVTKTNASDGHVAGVETVAVWAFARDWNLRLMGSWMEGRVKEFPTAEAILRDQHISRLMPLTGQMRVTWNPEGGGWSWSAVVDAAAQADRLSFGDERDTQRIPPGGTPGYVVAGIEAAWDPTEALQISLALRNLADEDYRIHGSGVNEPGRQLVATARWAF